MGSIGGILAGTTECPKIGQLQGLARRLGVNLSRLVAAAESDGCEQYEGDGDGDGDDAGKSADDEQQVDKACDRRRIAGPGRRDQSHVLRRTLTTRRILWPHSICNIREMFFSEIAGGGPAMSVNP